MRDFQDRILERLKSGEATVLERLLADNVTRAKYADFLWPEHDVGFRCHFMFHADFWFSGFLGNERDPACRYCREAEGMLIRLDTDTEKQGA